MPFAAFGKWHYKESVMQIIKVASVGAFWLGSVASADWYVNYILLAHAISCCAYCTHFRRLLGKSTQCFKT